MNNNFVAPKPRVTAQVRKAMVRKQNSHVYLKACEDSILALPLADKRYM